MTGWAMPDVKHFDPDAVLETVVRLFWRQGVATTGVQDIVNATGLNRSSLYATFGGKQRLYLAALERYVQSRSLPALERLAGDGRGLPAVTDFFAALIEARCTGEHARWGCMVSNAHAGAENGDPEVRAVLDRQHQGLRDALRAALLTARERGQLAPGADPESAADVLALLAHGVNLRSRAGADARRLRASVAAAIDAVTGRTGPLTGRP
ncbi:TetR/AcrR family transcriptional regulator [Actinomadura kijaniata]|uniref:TetR/AcrR family transcriptional regulator n=1 Tax=Actinomadura kijaniata TaxID=46161 RepID=UPI003F196626